MPQPPILVCHVPGLVCRKRFGPGGHSGTPSGFRWWCAWIPQVPNPGLCCGTPSGLGRINQRPLYLLRPVPPHLPGALDACTKRDARRAVPPA